MYPGESPLDDCRGVWCAVFLVMLPFLAWLIVAVVFLPLVIIFFPLPFIVMGLAPASGGAQMIGDALPHPLSPYPLYI